jgi:N-acetyl-1-D-myo-inositol-2-amino-2-deoxy-alpha-D-glucopyranoside deacetylase
VTPAKPHKARRLLLVHAHPDDETINTGATMAHYAAKDVQVTLVTCTLGEEGEVIGAKYAQLVADQADQLGGYRIGELTSAMAALGVTDHRFLGGAGRFRDSGMMGSPANEASRAFWRADDDQTVFEAAVEALVEVIREIRPQVVVTYDPRGSYGHPDHMMAHRVTTESVERSQSEGFGVGDPWSVDKVYWTTVPLSVLQAGADAVRDASGIAFTPEQDLSLGAADHEVTTVVDAPAQLAAKTAALTAHATQVVVRDGFYALSNDIGTPISTAEYYRLVVGEVGGPFDSEGREVDLFAGISS